MDSSLPSAQIRGIYATALTSLLLDLGVPIANPSPAIQERLAIVASSDSPAVLVKDRPYRQGVTLHGNEPDLRVLLEILRSALPRAVSRAEAGPQKSWSLEFPASIKSELDQRRRNILPTVVLHHQLKTISSDRVDIAEQQLSQAAQRLEELSERLRSDLVDRHIRPGTPIKVEHVKPAGQTYDLKGVVASFDGRSLRVDRRFHPGGTYDSLDVPRLKGDYGQMDVEIGSGIAVRRYFRANGRHIGDLYNLATEAE